MSNNSGSAAINCGLLFAFSLILGIVTTVLFLFGLITDIMAILPFIIVFSFLVMLTVTGALIECKYLKNLTDAIGEDEHQGDNKVCRCLKHYANCLFLSSTVAVISAFAILLTGIVTGVTATVIVFILSTAFFLILLALFAFINCLLSPTGRRFKS